MPIFGLNFNGQHIPDTAPRFAQRLKRRQDGTLRSVGSDSSCDFLLQGVCNTQEELGYMLVQANNGHRQFHAVVRNGWIGVYCG